MGMFTRRKVESTAPTVDEIVSDSCRDLSTSDNVVFNMGHLSKESNKFYNSNLWLITLQPHVRAVKRRIFTEYGIHIPEEYIYAIIKAESNGNPWAIRYEPNFYQWLKARVASKTIRQDKAAISRATEMNARSTSFGLMQVMGQTAREEGFTSVFMTELCNIDIGLYYGCKHLIRKYNRYNNWDKAFAAYNAGSARYKSSGKFVNQPYVDKIKYYAPRFKELLKDLDGLNTTEV